jgi:Phage integrase central domain
LQTRYLGKQATRRALGTPGKMTIEQAREKALEYYRLLDKHIDPKLQAERDRIAALRSQSNTFLSVAEAYFRHMQAEGKVKARARGSGVSVMEREIRKDFVKHWESRPIHEITTDDARIVIQSIKDRGSPGQAHVLFQHGQALFRWAIDSGAYGLETSPFDRLRATSVGPAPGKLRSDGS